jgi:hypothetical protein
MTNTNCLEGMQCPQCKSFEPFNIEVKTMIKVFDSGTGDHGNTDWDEDSLCECCECDFSGTVADFTEKAAPTAAARPRLEDVLDALEGLTASLSPRKVKPVLEAAGYDTAIWLTAHRHARAALRNAGK